MLISIVVVNDICRVDILGKAFHLAFTCYYSGSDENLSTGLKHNLIAVCWTNLVATCLQVCHSLFSGLCYDWKDKIVEIQHTSLCCKFSETGSSNSSR